MTQDQHDPTSQTAGSTESTAASATGADGGATTKTAGSRTPRRRHPANRGRQPKDTQETPETKEPKAAKAARAAKEAPEPQHAPEQAAVAETPAAPEAATATMTETPRRAATRGRRGGSNRRRTGKADVPDIQLVPVTSAPETETAPAAIEDLAETSLPTPEPLPLDTAILAHLDALSQAAGHQAAEEGIPTGSGEERPASAVAATEEETSPAQRRYRFDRPRGSAAAEPASVRPERLSGWRATPPTLLTPPPAAPETTPVSEEEAPISAEGEPVVVAEAVEEPAPSAQAVEAAETPEVIEAPAAEEGAAPTEVAAEEAEHVEHEGASRRRRRRRGRSGHGQEVETGEVEGDEQQAHAETPATRLPAPYAAPERAVSYAHDHETGNGYQSRGDAYGAAGYSMYTPVPRGRASRPSAPTEPATRQQEPGWSMSTAQQQIQESASPFGSPEPSFAHGFGPQPSGVASPVHEGLPRIRRGERSGDVPMSANQLGTIITGAITQQTDRLLGELRRQQYPPSMTVALPAFPSTERIGVFVDVANLLYSARSQRMSIDFGRLLDFLRSNRRLIRAHAYAPTNPDPHAEQTFLSAVKGVGYRITTKNYKTFASGARKADMDLDLCMDIVRLVDANALDTVVLVSGDSDFLPLLEYCSDHGVRVEVAAFDDAAAMILRQSCDLFINLSQVDEIRA